MLTKTSLILGLGEQTDEIEKTMDDLLDHKVDILTLGQYLRPTLNHLLFISGSHPRNLICIVKLEFKKVF